MASVYKSVTMQAPDSDTEFSEDDNLPARSNGLDRQSSPAKQSPEGHGEPSVEAHVTEGLAAIPLEVRNRVLMLTSRGVSYRHRHLVNDLYSLLPHTYKDAKLDTKSSNNYNAALNALADLHSCNYVSFFEARRRGQDLYLWLARAPNGPTLKFSVSNIHTMGELGFGGNCLKGGRGIVVFDKSFDDHMSGFECRSLMREMLRGIFCVPPRTTRGMKPFIDRVVGIYGLDGKIWIRVYEIREPGDDGKVSTKAGSEVTLVEIGPRLVLTPVVVLEGSFGGAVLYENRSYISRGQIAKLDRREKAFKHARRTADADERSVKRQSMYHRGLDELNDSTVFG